MKYLENMLCVCCLKNNRLQEETAQQLKITFNIIFHLFEIQLDILGRKGEYFSARSETKASTEFTFNTIQGMAPPYYKPRLFQDELLRLDL